MPRVHRRSHQFFAVSAVLGFLSLAPLGSGAEPKELKVVAQGSFVDGFGPFSASKSETQIIRSAEELVAVSAVGRAAKDPAAAQKDLSLQKEVEKQLAEALKVEKIDWRKQMVIVVATDLGQAHRVTPKVELLSLKVKGEKLTPTLTDAKKEYGTYGRYPGVVALIEKHEGKLEVVWEREK